MNEQHEALRKFSYQVNYAVEQYKQHQLEIKDFNNILIGGLGGSGIGGRLVKNIFIDECPVPVECIADYSIPAWVNEKTLCILASYSGNTEETLTMFDEVQKRGCKILVLTSGGKLGELAKENNLATYHTESGFQPRMALGFSLSFLVLIFGELLKKDVATELRRIAEKLSDTSPYEEDGQKMFEKIKARANNKFIVVSDAYFEATAVRFSQQINENAKHECFTHVLPEANHNVIESYYGQLNSVYFFLDSGKNERVTARFEFLTNLLEVENNRIVNLAVDHFDIAAVYEVIYRLDWLSLYVADYRRVDSLNVPNIASLKEFLSQI
jgi:glucose/mannose-6-phosphate isomerase